MKKQNPIKNLDEFIQKIDAMKKREKMDLSSNQDLSIAIMNLVSIEEHFFFTGAKTGKKKYFDLLEEIREMRKTLLKKLIKETEGELWCISKHLLAASMRLMEVGAKALSIGKKKQAYDFFDKAYNLYSLFWGINMNLIETKNITKIDNQALNQHDQKKKGLLGKLGELVKKIVNCCIE
ncbi:MAG: Uncharacterized protein CEN89_675 [Candidatus Berkelbacteria bacterium Licking1014_7]|uniref:Uncharacterized protein n=1 Tax=Candidatus Berkelbacteria bacterium Licking1014_7 TaxID=2017147 RepID=A0A554LI01_9BACT|nr:MAG: Uncharacterized protein CEN89_675 [Candidatus Berkelbacteria bacterium Licking1014_7]